MDSLDPTELRQLLKTMRQRRDALNAEALELIRQVRALTQTIHGLQELVGDDEPEEDEAPRLVQPDSIPSEERFGTPAVVQDYPRGVEAVRRILMDTGREMDTREITDELLRRGWVPRSSNPLNATSSNAARAVELPDVWRRKSEHGTYLYWYEPPRPPKTADVQLQPNGTTLEQDEVKEEVVP